ncbi:MAG: aldehyde ferredoxin oxidoreductase family protein [Deltaproteobacteria bacterium]|nr:aldehyde ferredoxin oxidoreductase family protein [Deltaproteobacteria bacterium]
MPRNREQFLRINLAERTARVEPVPEEVTSLLVGGRGYGASHLHRELPPHTDPLGEGNKLLFLAGALAGTAAQASSRWMVCTKSPLTGAFARSVGGADFGAWLRFVGYAFLLIEGRAERPCYVHLTPEGCTVRDATELWGRDTVETQKWLQEHHGSETRAACIGPAGEKLVRYAAIVSGRRSASRCGVGTEMGSKNLKAVAITAKRTVRLHDPERFLELAKEQANVFRVNGRFQHHRKMGTTDTQDLTNALGVFPVRNFRLGQQEGCQRVSGQEYRRLRTGEFGCYNCSARCGKAHAVTQGPYAGASSEGPEYESIWAFTGTIDSTSIEASIAADQLCDELGVDTISTGNSIGFAYELYEKGLIGPAETDGLELAYGKHEPLLPLIRKIAAREGFGAVLAEGVRRAATLLGRGAEAYAIHVKGLELPAYEPRGAKSHGFNYATSNIGASHCYGYAGQEIFGVPIPRAVDRFVEAENADIVVHNQNVAAMVETGIACTFSRSWGWFPELFAKLLVAATGREEFGDAGYLRQAGERIVNLERSFNVREGFGREEDRLPERMTTEPLRTADAPGDGQVVREMEEFLDRYYRLRGWTPDGAPTPERLEELGLTRVMGAS